MPTPPQLPNRTEDRLSSAGSPVIIAEVEDLLGGAVARWRERIALVTSFQAGGMVLVDVASRVAPELRVLTLDTGRLPQETFDLIEQVRSRYRIDVEVIYPNADEVHAMVRRGGPDLFRRSVEGRIECCATRKSAPIRRVFRDLDAWITGARSSQASTRTSLARTGPDPVHDGLLKLAPLADWSEAAVWHYLHDNDVPYSALYRQGYRSIGCAPCTRPVSPGEDPRAGRWWWERGAHKECGLHRDAERIPAAGGCG